MLLMDDLSLQPCKFFVNAENIYDLIVPGQPGLHKNVSKFSFDDVSHPILCVCPFVLFVVLAWSMLLAA